MFRVSVKKKVLKDAEKMPVSVQENLAELLEDLREKGSVRPDCKGCNAINAIKVVKPVKNI